MTLDTTKAKDRFPVCLFLIYVIYYAGQAIYGSYISLYLDQLNFTKTQIGLVNSIPVAFLLVTQFLWGVANDKSRYRNTVLIILYVCCIASLFLFYTSQEYVLIILFITLLQIFYSPIAGIQDNMSLELQKDSKWDFGKIRLGGTVGYAICAAVIGSILLNFFNSDYSHIFWMMAICMTVALLFLLTLPKVKGHRKPKEKVNYRLIFQNPALLCLIFYNLIYTMGMNIFYTYYSIYFTDVLHATSQDVGILLFCSAMTEVPMLLLSKKLVNRFGFSKFMIAAGLITSVRWLLLFMIKSIPAVIGVNLLHGAGFVGFHFCIVLFINDNVPPSMRASAQMLNAVISMIFSKVLFGLIGGALCDLFGVDNIMLVMSVIMLAASVIFALWYRSIDQKRKASLETLQ